MTALARQFHRQKWPEADIHTANSNVRNPQATQ